MIVYFIFYNIINYDNIYIYIYMNYSIIIISHDIESANDTQNSLLPYESKVFIGKEYDSFSKIVKS
jgi:hypothetical protein